MSHFFFLNALLQVFIDMEQYKNKSSPAHLSTPSVSDQLSNKLHMGPDRSAVRAQQELKLPLELLDNILRYVDQSTCVSLGRANRALARATQRHLLCQLEICAYGVPVPRQTYVRKHTVVRRPESLLTVLKVNEELTSHIQTVRFVWAHTSNESQHESDDQLFSDFVGLLTSRTQSSKLTHVELEACGSDHANEIPSFIDHPHAHFDELYLSRFIVYGINAFSTTMHKWMSAPGVRRVKFDCFPVWKDFEAFCQFEPLSHIMELKILESAPPTEVTALLLAWMPFLQRLTLQCSPPYQLGVQQYHYSTGTQFSSAGLLSALNPVKHVLEQLHFSATYDKMSPPEHVVGMALASFSNLTDLRVPIDFLIRFADEDDERNGWDESEIPSIKTVFPSTIEKLTIQTNPALEWYEYGDDFMPVSDEHGGYKIGKDASRVLSWLAGIPVFAPRYYPRIKIVHITTVDGLVGTQECPVEYLQQARQLIDQFKQANVELILR